MILTRASGFDFEHDAFASLGWAAREGCSVEIANPIDQQRAMRNSSVHRCRKVIKHGFLANRIYLEYSSESVRPSRAATISGAIKVACMIKHNPTGRACSIGLVFEGVQHCLVAAGIHFKNSSAAEV